MLRRGRLIRTGSWTYNKRVGKYESLSAKGVPWSEKYDDSGKRVGRIKVRKEVPNPDFGKVPEAPETIKELVEPEPPARKVGGLDDGKEYG